jgi:type VI secretion system secreted protein VgrG
MASPKIRVESPLGAGALLVHRLRGHEELGRLFSYSVDLLATKPISKLSKLLGEELAIVLDVTGQQERAFHGFVTDIKATGTHSRFVSYRVTLRPWLWFLTRNASCRIFQRLAVPDIVTQILRERGFTDVETSLSESYANCEYSVQYRESEFDFVSRLLEREGIYYFFRHEKGKHTLVLADGQGSHGTVPSYEQLPFFPPQQGAGRERDHLDAWTVTQQIQPGAVVLNAFDYQRPKANLEVKVEHPRSHARDSYEQYDYPGGYLQTNDGELYARARLEEFHAQFETFHGGGNVRGLHPGALFKLTRFPTQELNQEYLVTKATYVLDAGEYDSSGTMTSDAVFHCDLSAVTSATPYRPARLTPRPHVSGPQTAIVVGKQGEEIWTDELGRVKVQFHWDREGARDENSSCWVRVSQAMAGAGWGAIHVPRTGQEVVVSFLEGDPDQPLVTGRVYNGNQAPPFALPDAGMVSGYKTDSTPGGGGYNELSMDDTKGKEKLILHAQYDMATTVEHDQVRIIHNNRSATVDADDLEEVGKNQTIKIGESQRTAIKKDQSLLVDGNQDATIKKKRSEKIDGAATLTIGDTYDISVTKALREDAKDTKSVKVGKGSSEQIGDSKSVRAGKNIEAKADADIEIAAGKKLTAKAGDDLRLAGSKKGVIEISDELTIKVGSAQITLKSNGDITIKGKKLTLNGSGDVVLKGSKVSHN